MSADSSMGREDEIDILKLVGVVASGWPLVICCLCFAILAGTVLILLTDPVYRADGLLQLEQKRSGLALPTAMQDLVAEDSASVTEIEILRSRMVLGTVVDQLDLDVVAEPRRLPVIGKALDRLNLPDPSLQILKPYAWAEESILIGEFEVPERWVGEVLTITAQGDGRYNLLLPDGTTREGAIREVLRDDALGLSLRIDQLEGPADRQFTLVRREVADVVSGLRDRFSVSEVGRQSSILNIQLTAASPGRAAMVLDAIAQAYVAQNVSRSSIEAQRSLDFIDEQLPKSEQEVAEAQNALNAYRQQQQSVDLNYETQSLLDQATALEQELSKLRLQEEELKERYTINHPAYQALLTNRVQLQADLDRLREEAASLPETQKEIFNLTRNLEVAQQVYLQLLNRVQELQVLRASSIGSVRIIDTAQASADPIAPRKGRTLALAAILGLVVGVGLVLLRHMTRRGVKGGEELDRIGLPVFATINYSNDAANHRSIRGTLPILAITKPNDLVVEALRSLRTSLHFGMLDALTNSVLLTSAAPGAGKSFNAVNLAVVTAQAGQRVCLIDADMRRGYLRRYFGVERNAPGLAEVLAGERTVEDVMVSGPIGGMSVLTSGRFPPNPSELLMRASFTELLASLNQRFDLIIIDGPPALAVTDPVIMSRSVGATIVVVRHLETALGEVEAVRRAMETSGSKLAGAILNGYREMGRGYGSDYYYNYRYAYQTDTKSR
ncbi:polysaccharide biosynthesis tyrosine autokinase [Cereibacter changlensis]|uniref:Polysaccharide biosynthesis tyrosine autokinase n=1 Tax=Cereibacter changlensis TaxID=402884 RepID=A0A4U0YWQ4_9RHOB|nr:polysaccharide biosynthesis tyrosine autokinase [Cereibacter changlensis]TKA96245.1 polysaccharide biosynthesis tyrosine autokinase [Cereibacter changlensis]